MTIASYAAARRGLLLWLVFSFTSGSIILGLVQLLVLSGGVLGAIRLVFFLGMGAGYAYFSGFRTICLVELTNTELRWRSPLRGRAVALSEVRSIRYAKVETRRGSQSVATVEFTGRRPVRFVAAKPGLADFMASVHAAAPHVTVEPPGQ
jgi:hypothetical protein